MAEMDTVEIPIEGMDCAECTLHVQKAIAGLPGVEGVDVFLASEKAVVRMDPAQVGMASIQQAVEKAGYSIRATPDELAEQQSAARRDFTRPVLSLLGLMFGAVLFVVVVGEWLGLFEAITAWVPWPVGVAAVLVAGYPVFMKVIRAALNRQIISHTLMTLGVIAALAVGEWTTAGVIVFFMRIGDYVERFTAERARRAVKDLVSLAPRTARVDRQGVEIELPIEQVQPGDIVIVRPGEMIPVDGVVIDGQATVNQAAITGEAMPVDAGPGAHVYAATLASLGSLRVQATQIGPDSTYGRVIKLVEEAEAHRADVQQVADKFSAYYLPIVAGIAALTYLVRGDPLAAAAVLVVACSCSFALATPIAMLASIGAGAKRGVMIKGGKYLEVLSHADMLLIDKTGTLTLGKPEITDILSLANGEQGEQPPEEILQLAASAERYSEHPLAEAVRLAALERGLPLLAPKGFEAIPGSGVRATVNGSLIEVGNHRLLESEPGWVDQNLENRLESLQAEGKTLLLVRVDGRLSGALAAADMLRPEVPHAIQQVRSLGIKRVELITGDNRHAAQDLAGQLGIDFRAELLPEDKIAIVKEYQSLGHRVIMVGDGVNDAPALAQADVGIAMGAAGSDIAIEAAHIALMREDWLLVPQVLRIAARTMRVVKGNIAFTAVYNLVGLSLAAMGYLPPIFAAAAQSLPDLGILANSSRLLRQKE
jgi:Cd2+/Zn2+-exporting ATPase/Cu+-exporting ATPase